jgi:hypothetical protein
MHHYEQVDHPSNKAVTLTFGTNGGRDRGGVTGPTEIIFGQRWSLKGAHLPRQKPLQWLRSWRIDWDFPSWWSIQMAFGTQFGVNSTVPLGPALAA